MQDALVANILATYRQANPAHVREGKRWYAEARQLARDLSLAYGVSERVAAGVIAALSPRLSWELNQPFAAQFLATGNAPVLGRSKRAAARIVAGERIESVLTAPKVAAFFACIMGEDAVCVDSHAHDIALGERYGSRPRVTLNRKGGYELLAGAYRTAAAEVGIPARHLQAITWVAWREWARTRGQLSLEGV